MDKFEIFAKKLAEEKSKLIIELKEIAVHNTETDDWEVRIDNTDHNESDPNMVADSSETAEERTAILAELETRYRNIVHALKKIEAGTYGICEISGEKIETARLEANPAARTCIAHLEDESKLLLA